MVLCPMIPPKRKPGDLGADEFKHLQKVLRISTVRKRGRQNQNEERSVVAVDIRIPETSASGSSQE